MEATKVPRRNLFLSTSTASGGIKVDVSGVTIEKDKTSTVDNDVMQRRKQFLEFRTKTTTVPIVGLGCSSFSMFFGNGNSFTADTIQRNHPLVIEWIDTIKHAILVHGITLLDTAPWYGHGISEIVVGYALHDLLQQQKDQNDSVQRNELIINTKVGRYESDALQQFDFTHDTTVKSIKRSIQRLNISYINIVQLHDCEFSPSLDILLNETIPAMYECCSAGCSDNNYLCIGIGLTGFPLSVQHQILQACFSKYDNTHIFDMSLTYGHYNLYNTNLISEHKYISSACAVNSKIADSEGETATKEVARAGNVNNDTKLLSFIEYCHDANIAVLAAAPLGMGLLVQSVQTTLPVWHPANNTMLHDACIHAASICKNDDNNDVDELATLAILYAVSNTTIPCTIIGMKNIKQVDTAATIAKRFSSVNATDSSSNLFSQVVTESEAKVWAMLQQQSTTTPSMVQLQQDENNNNTWDGIRQVRDFYEQDEFKNSTTKIQQWQKY